jgi:hypothetical protein
MRILLVCGRNGLGGERDAKIGSHAAADFEAAGDSGPTDVWEGVAGLGVHFPISGAN